MVLNVDLLKDLTGSSLHLPQKAKVAINAAHLLSLYLQVLPPQKVENPGKSQTKGAVRGAAFPA